MVTVEEASIHPQLPHVPKMPGADLPHVTTAHDVLAGKVAIGKSPVAVIGGFGKSSA